MTDVRWFEAASVELIATASAEKLRNEKRRIIESLIAGERVPILTLIRGSEVAPKMFLRALDELSEAGNIRISKPFGLTSLQFFADRQLRSSSLLLDKQEVGSRAQEMNLSVEIISPHRAKPQPNRPFP